MTLCKTVGITSLFGFAAFGWDSCDKGGWFKKLMEKVPDIAVRSCSDLAHGDLCCGRAYVTDPLPFQKTHRSANGHLDVPKCETPTYLVVIISSLFRSRRDACLITLCRSLASHTYGSLLPARVSQSRCDQHSRCCLLMPHGSVTDCVCWGVGMSHHTHVCADLARECCAHNGSLRPQPQQELLPAKRQRQGVRFTPVHTAGLPARPAV